MKRVFLLLAGLLLLSLSAQAATPVLFYTDIDSGPAVGGEGGRDGAFVCLYGENFGAKRGTSMLTVGGVEAAAYKLWTDPGAPYTPGYYAKACAQISRHAKSGLRTIQLTTAGGTSNQLPFTVRAGSIYWVDAAGNDGTGTGSQASPWGTITKCKNKLRPGDLCLIGNGVTLDKVDGAKIALRLDSSGSDTTPASCGSDYTLPCGPKTIVAYPGAMARVDVHTVNGGRPLQTFLPKDHVHYWTIAGMIFNGNSFSIGLQAASDIRLVDNEILCQGWSCNGSYSSAGLATKWVNNLWVYGNRFHDIGCHEDNSTPTSYRTSTSHCSPQTSHAPIASSGTTLTTTFGGLPAGDVVIVNGQLRRTMKGSPKKAGAVYEYVLDAPFSPDAASGTVSSWQWRDYAPSKLYHNIYFGTQTDHVWFGWNSVNGNGMACRGVLFHSTGGRSQYDLHVHDNVIHDTVCDGIDFATVDPSQGVVEAYNNVIYNAGRGPDPIDGPASYAGIFNPGITHLGTSGSGDILIYNNTLYNCGNNPAGLYPADRGAIGAKKGYAPNLRMALTNNILVQTNPSIPYFSSGSNGAVSGSSNDCWGGEGGCPAQLAHSLRVDPGFVNPRDADFRILADSPVRQAKLAAIQPATDQDGHVRPPKATIGAFEPPSGKTGGQ